MPGIWKKMVALLLCAALLPGCSGRSAPQGPAVPPEVSSYAPFDPDPEPGDLVFAISRDASSTLRAAAEYFCGEYSRLTGRGAEVRSAIAPDADLLAGRAQAALLNKRRQFEFNHLLEATATPFLYTSYKNFAMRANARGTLSMLERSLREQNRLIPFAAFYQGSLHVLSEAPVTGYQQLELEYFAISDDNEIKDMLERALVIPVIADTDEERYGLLMAEDAKYAELSLEYLAALTPEEPLSLTLSCHNLIPVWLVATDEFYKALDEATRAELAEVIAAMNHMVDDAYRAADEAALTALKDTGMVQVAEEFAVVRNRVFNMMPALLEDASTQRKLARNLLDDMRRIG